jgi:hypothetical protein
LPRGTFKTVLAVAIMTGKDDSAKQSETRTQADVPRDFIKAGSSPGPLKVVFWEPSVPLEKFTHGGRPKNQDLRIRDRYMAVTFLQKKKTSRWKKTKLMEQVGGSQGLAKSGAINAIQSGFQVLVDDFGTPEMKEDVSSRHVLAIDAACHILDLHPDIAKKILADAPPKLSTKRD